MKVKQPGGEVRLEQRHADGKGKRKFSRIVLTRERLDDVIAALQEAAGRA